MTKHRERKFHPFFSREVLLAVTLLVVVVFVVVVTEGYATIIIWT